MNFGGFVEFYKGRERSSEVSQNWCCHFYNKFELKRRIEMANKNWSCVPWMHFVGIVCEISFHSVIHCVGGCYIWKYVILYGHVGLCISWFDLILKCNSQITFYLEANTIKSLR